MSPDSMPQAPSLQDQIKDLEAQIEEANAGFDGALAGELEAKKKVLEQDIAEPSAITTSTTESLEGGTVLDSNELDEKYSVVSGLEKSGASEAFLAEAQERARKYEGVSFEYFKRGLSGHVIKNNFDDGVGHDGPGAAGYGIAIMNSVLSDSQKLELLNDLYSGMSGFTGEAAKRIIDGYKKEVEERLASPQGVVEGGNHLEKSMEEQTREVVNTLKALGEKTEYTGSIDRVAMAAVKEKLSTLDQEAVAVAYFNATIGEYIGNNRTAYQVYIALKGTPFANKFHELEDARLKEWGSSGFIL